LVKVTEWHFESNNEVSIIAKHLEKIEDGII